MAQGGGMKLESTHAHDHWLKLFATDAVNEAQRGVSIHGPHHSYHEGYAVLLEEVDELWGEIKAKEPDHGRIANEATQVAAMALRVAVMARRNLA